MNDPKSLGYVWIAIALAALLGILFVVMVIWAFVKIRAAHRAKKEFERRPPGYFVFAKIVESIMPMDRGVKYERPLSEVLRSRGLGFVTGAGTQVDREKKKVEWVGLDLELSNLEEALLVVRDTLHDLGAPAGSTLEYRVGEEKKVLEIS